MKSVVYDATILGDGHLPVPDDLSLKAGTVVHVRLTVLDAPSAAGGAPFDFASLPAFGMWADRKEMSDAAGYVRSLRKGWDRRRHATGESR